MGRKAHQFHCDKTLEEIQAILNQAGPWEWIMRDSAWYGDYLWANPAASVKIKIYEPVTEAGPPFTIQVEGTNKTLPPSELSAVITRWYEALGATEIKRCETYD